MLLNKFIEDSTRVLEELYPRDEARKMVMILCEELLGIKNYTHIVDPGYQVRPEDAGLLDKALDELRSGAPLQYVLGFADFCDLRFKVGPAVLIPRPETELMVREAVKIAQRVQRMRSAYGKSAEPVRILDLCTGSGCIAWTLALNVPGSRVVAADISEEALDIARNQDFEAELKERQANAPEFVKADILEVDQSFPYGPFDMIVSNPPYILPSEKSLMRKNVLDFEPAIALFTTEDDPMLYYKAIASWSAKYLTAEGKALTEINERLALETKAVLREAGFSNTEVIKDFYDKNRFILYHK